MRERQSGFAEITESSAESWEKYIEPVEGESPEAYIRRVPDCLASERIEQEFLAEKKNARNISKVLIDVEKAMVPHIAALLAAPRRRRSSKYLTKEFLDFADDSRIGTTKNEITDAEDKMAYFARTDTERKFFEHESSNSASIYRIFGLPEKEGMKGRPLEKSIQAILESRINGKVIYMLGGGDYGRDFLASDLFSPKQIVNIDPYHAADAVEKNRRKNYISLPLRAESAELGAELAAEGIPQADEIWATYSVPMYLETAEQIGALFDNIDACLAKGGVARITPIRLLNFVDESKAAFNADPLPARQKAWTEAVLKLLQSGRYNLEILDSTMRLEKIDE